MDLNLDELDIQTIKNGFVYNPESEQYTCLICGDLFIAGEIYKFGERFFDAAHAVKLHILHKHENVFYSLLNYDSRYISFTENQEKLLRMIYDGLSDNQIASELRISPSTVRHQKFMFREKVKQAKMYLAIYELATEKKQHEQDIILPVHKGAKMVDDRYIITKEESDKIITAHFESLSPLKLKVLSPKEKKKIVILRKISEQFEKDKIYTEKEVNQILEDIYDDYATVRRYLIEYGFMERANDGSRYWLK